jgi:hypothetical protein
MFLLAKIQNLTKMVLILPIVCVNIYGLCVIVVEQRYQNHSNHSSSNLNLGLFGILRQVARRPRGLAKLFKSADEQLKMYGYA